MDKIDQNNKRVYNAVMDKMSSMRNWRSQQINESVKKALNEHLNNVGFDLFWAKDNSAKDKLEHTPDVFEIMNDSTDVGANTRSQTTK